MLQSLQLWPAVVAGGSSGACRATQAPVQAWDLGPAPEAAYAFRWEKKSWGSRGGLGCELAHETGGAMTVLWCTDLRWENKSWASRGGLGRWEGVCALWYAHWLGPASHTGRECARGPRGLVTVLLSTDLRWEEKS